VSGSGDPVKNDREQLERFLEWKRAQQRDRRARTRSSLLYVAATVSLGVGGGSLALVVWLTAGAGDMRQRPAAEARREPVADVPASPAPPGPRATAPVAGRAPRRSSAASEVGAPPHRPRSSPPRPALPERPPPGVTATATPPPPSPPAREPLAAEAPAALPQSAQTPAAPPPASENVQGPRPAPALVRQPTPATVASEGPSIPTREVAPEPPTPIPPPMVHRPPGVIPGAEALHALRRQTLSTAVPDPAPAWSSTLTVPPPAPRAAPVAVSAPQSETVEALKRLVNYMPEVRVGKAIVRWVKAQPPAGSWRPPEPRSPEAQ